MTIAEMPNGDRGYQLPPRLVTKRRIVTRRFGFTEHVRVLLKSLAISATSDKSNGNAMAPRRPVYTPATVPGVRCGGGGGGGTNDRALSCVPTCIMFYSGGGGLTLPDGRTKTNILPTLFPVADDEPLT